MPRRLTIVLLLCLCLKGNAGPASELAPPPTPTLTAWMNCFVRIALFEEFDFDADRFDSILADPKWNGDAIMDYLSKSAPFKELYAADAFTIQNFIVRQHTGHVFHRAQEQFPWFPAGIRTPGRHTWLELLKVAIALHDIGKPVAGESGDKKRAPQFTVPIVELILERLAFSKPERALIIALIGHDFVGDVAQKNTTPAYAQAQITRLANEIGMDPTDFFRLQLFFYIIDASTYQNVIDLIFIRTPEGRMLPDKQAPLVELQKLFNTK